MTLVNESLNLKHSLQSSTISTLYSPKEHGGYYNSIVETQTWLHCILKEVFHPNEDVNTISPPWMFDSLIFKVSFIGKNGLEDPSFTNILLSGNAMNQVIICVLKIIKLKPKYLYNWTKKMAKHFTLSQAGDMM
jgi:hypothetical protein